MIRWVLVIIGLLSATIALYWPATAYEFVNLDDYDNVARNDLIINGLTPGGLLRAMRTSDPDYWRPLTWVSYMIDTEMHQVQAQPAAVPAPVQDSSSHSTLSAQEIPQRFARGYHLTNIILHALAAVMLLGAMNALTGTFWRSAFIAALFAMHPLRVESVVWITERKDVLSGVFAFGMLWSYALYGRGKGLHWLIAATILLGMGLMSKATLVTLPFVLILLDYWPLRRIRLDDRWRLQGCTFKQLLIEKIPMFSIALASCFITMYGGQRSVADLSMRLRLPNVVVSYLRYIGKVFWPSDLCVYYPYPGIIGLDRWHTWQVAAAGVVLFLITLWAVAQSRRQPYLIAGWLWFVGMLVPVIGILQVGNQGLADRFLYLPMIGLSIAVVWLIVESLPNRVVRIGVLAPAAVAVLIGCGVITARQLPTWKTTDALYQHALDVTHNNRAVHVYYGDYLFHQNRLNEALVQFQKTAELTPFDAMPHFKLGLIFVAIPNNFEAQKEFEKSLDIDPKNADAQFNLALVLARRDQPAAAREHLRRALELNPAAKAHYSELETVLNQRPSGSASQ